jgi:hypothetical protein
VSAPSAAAQLAALVARAGVDRADVRAVTRALSRPPLTGPDLDRWEALIVLLGGPELAARRTVEAFRQGGMQ